MSDTAVLAVQGIQKAFRGVKALDGVSLAVRTGEILGLIGPNGAGKTTLFSVITGFVAPDAGDVVLAGRSVRGLKPHRICRLGLTKTFQITRPFEALTAREDVMVAALAAGRQTMHEARARAADYLAFVGLQDRLNAPAVNLSTGQRKRLEFARALATNPRVLLLDEPLGGVDQRTWPGLVDLILRLRTRGMTIVVIEHNLKALQNMCDRIVALHLGRVLTEGAPSDVVTDQRVLDAYFGKD